MLDAKENLNRPPKDKTTKHVDPLLLAVRSCGVSFSIWEKKDADGKASSTFDCTSLMGSDKKQLPKYLLEMLHNRPDAVEENIRNTVIKLWTVSDNYNTCVQCLIYIMEAN